MFTVKNIIGRTCRWGNKPLYIAHLQDAYLTYELSSELEKIIKYAKLAVDMCNQLTHDRNATKRAATICIVGVSSIAALIKGISEKD